MAEQHSAKPRREFCRDNLSTVAFRTLQYEAYMCQVELTLNSSIHSQYYTLTFCSLRLYSQRYTTQVHTTISSWSTDQNEINDSTTEVKGRVVWTMNHWHCLTVAKISTRHSTSKHHPSWLTDNKHTDTHYTVIAAFNLSNACICPKSTSCLKQLSATEFSFKMPSVSASFQSTVIQRAYHHCRHNTSFCFARGEEEEISLATICYEFIYARLQKTCSSNLSSLINNMHVMSYAIF